MPTRSKPKGGTHRGTAAAEDWLTKASPLTYSKCSKGMAGCSRQGKEHSHFKGTDTTLYTHSPLTFLLIVRAGG